MATKTLTKEEVLEAIKGMTVLDLAELIKALEQEFGVSAAVSHSVCLGSGCPILSRHVRFDKNTDAATPTAIRHHSPHSSPHQIFCDAAFCDRSRCVPQVVECRLLPDPVEAAIDDFECYFRPLADMSRQATRLPGPSCSFDFTTCTWRRPTAKPRARQEPSQD